MLVLLLERFCSPAPLCIYVILMGLTSMVGLNTKCGVCQSHIRASSGLSFCNRLALRCWRSSNSSGPTVAPFCLSVRKHILQGFLFKTYFFSSIKLPEIMRAALLITARLLCSTTEMSERTFSFAIPTGSLETEFDFWRTREYSVNVKRWVVMDELWAAGLQASHFLLFVKAVSLLYVL